VSEVSVRVAAFHTSLATDAPEVSVRVADAHTAAGSAARLAPRDEEAVSTVALVFALMTAASDDDAMPTLLSVFALMAVWLLVIAVPSDEDAVCTSDNVASEPLVKPAPVKVRVAALQTSVAMVPKLVSVRTDAFQTFTGIDVASEVEAVCTAALVFAFTTAAMEDDAVPIVVVNVDVAVFMSAFVASAPEESAAVVRERVP